MLAFFIIVSTCVLSVLLHPQSNTPTIAKTDIKDKIFLIIFSSYSALPVKRNFTFRSSTGLWKNAPVSTGTVLTDTFLLFSLTDSMSQHALIFIFAASKYGLLFLIYYSESLHHIHKGVVYHSIRLFNNTIDIGLFRVQSVNIVMEIRQNIPNATHA